MQQTNTNLVLFSYSSRGATYPFFSDFNFNLNTSHKSLDFLFSIDDLDNHTQALQCDILFLEENATISDAIIKTLENTDNIYLIFNNSSGHVQDRLQKISKGKIFRKIISDDLEKEISISLIELMAKAFKERNKNKYNATYSQLKQLFNYDLIMETKLKLLQSSSNPKKIRTYLETCNQTEQIIISKILKIGNVKNLLQTLSGNELTEPEAIKKIRAALFNEIYCDQSLS